MDVQLKLNGAKLKATQIEGEQADAIIKGFFSVLGSPNAKENTQEDVQKKIKRMNL